MLLKNTMYLWKTYHWVFQISLNSAASLSLLPAKIVWKKLITPKTSIKYLQTPNTIPETIRTRILIQASDLSFLSFLLAILSFRALSFFSCFTISWLISFFSSNICYKQSTIIIKKSLFQIFILCKFNNSSCKCKP